MSCNFCSNETYKHLEIKEAYGKNKLINEQIGLWVQNDNKCLIVDFINKEADGFYIDIVFCPMCGCKLNEN